MKLAFYILILLAGMTFAQSVPVRSLTPPLPLLPHPSKKTIRAQELRKEADELEASARLEERMNIEALQFSISTKISPMQFSTEKFTVNVKSINYMVNGTNLIAQISFSFLENQDAH